VNTAIELSLELRSQGCANAKHRFKLNGTIERVDRGQINLQIELIAATILLIGCEKQATQRHQNQTQDNTEQARFDHGGFSFPKSSKTLSHF